MAVAAILVACELFQVAPASNVIPESILTCQATKGAEVLGSIADRKGLKRPQTTTAEKPASDSTASPTNVTEQIQVPK